MAGSMSLRKSSVIATALLLTVAMSGPVRAVDGNLVVRAGDRTGLGLVAVPDRGLILTSSELIEGRQHVSVAGPGGRRLPARVIRTEERLSLSVIQVSPQAVAGIPELTWPEQPPSAARGDEVSILGGPAGGTTRGRVRRAWGRRITVETAVSGDQASLRSGPWADRPWALGSPVLDAEGRLLGVIGRRPSVWGSGRTVSATRIDLARSLIESAAEQVVGSDPPRAIDLQQVAPGVYPVALARQVAKERGTLSPYRLPAQRMHLELITPVSVAALARTQGAMSYEEASGFFNWQRFRGMTERAVVVRAVPRLQRTAGSRARVAGVVAYSLLYPLLLTAAVFTGEEPPPLIGPGPPTYRLAPAPREIRVRRGASLATPLRTELECLPRYILLSRKGRSKPRVRRVKGCTLLAWYAPEVFSPGERVIVQVVIGKPDTREVEGKTLRTLTVPVATLELVTADFHAHQTAVEEARQPGSAPAAASGGDARRRTASSRSR